MQHMRFIAWNKRKTWKPKPGVPNQSIAIYRSIFKWLAVDRGWFYACI